MQRTSAPNIGEAPLPQRARSYWRTRISALHEKLEKLLVERIRGRLKESGGGFLRACSQGGHFFVGFLCQLVRCRFRSCHAGKMCLGVVLSSGEKVKPGKSTRPPIYAIRLPSGQPQGARQPEVCHLLCQKNWCLFLTVSLAGHSCKRLMPPAVGILCRARESTSGVPPSRDSPVGEGGSARVNDNVGLRTDRQVLPTSGCPIAFRLLHTQTPCSQAR